MFYVSTVMFYISTNCSMSAPSCSTSAPTVLRQHRHVLHQHRHVLHQHQLFYVSTVGGGVSAIIRRVQTLELCLISPFSSLAAQMLTAAEERLILLILNVNDRYRGLWGCFLPPSERKWRRRWPWSCDKSPAALREMFKVQSWWRVFPLRWVILLTLINKWLLSSAWLHVRYLSFSLESSRSLISFPFFL